MTDSGREKRQAAPSPEARRRGPILFLKKYWAIYAVFLLPAVAGYGGEPSIHEEGVRILQEYLKIDTTNPPGNEMKTAVFLKKILDEEGIENAIFDLGHGRANLYAVLRGDGSRRPIILLHHMDVVPADPGYWSVPPFSGEIAGGHVYGRGAIDIKGKGIVDLMAMIELKRRGAPLRRDIVLLAVADEEVNSIGSKWMIANKPELIGNAEYLFDEGAMVEEDERGDIRYFCVGIGEKSPLWLTLTFAGPSGHASVPLPDSSVNRALRAANRVLDYGDKLPFNVIPGLEEIIKLTYEGDLTRLPGYRKDLTLSLKDEDFLRALARQPDINALLRDTIAVTCMKGSDKINTIPNEASVSLDCRLIPGEDRNSFIAGLKKAVGDDTMRIVVEEYYGARYSPSDTKYLEVLRKIAENKKPGTKVVPTIFTSSTDSSLYRALGIHCYGFESYKATKAIAGTAHGNDERIKVDSIEFGIDLLLEVLSELQN